MAASVAIRSQLRRRTVALVGNPNTGKSTLFTALTGHRQQVGNFPGTTVERRTGFLPESGDAPPIKLVDLPGTYSLGAHARDEAVVLDVLLGHRDGAAVPDLVVVVVDASTLRRNLFLTTQILEIGRPTIVALNMVDVAEASGIHIDAEELNRSLGVPVVPVIATKQDGIESLRRSIIDSLDAPAPQHCADFPECVCAELDGLTRSVAEGGNRFNHTPSRVEILQTLLDPGGYHEHRLVKRCGRELAAELAERRGRIERAGESVAEIEAHVRYAWIHGVVESVTTCVETPARPTTDLVDRFVTHRVFGLLILVAMMGLCFQAVYAWSSPAIDLIDGVITGLGSLATELIPPGALHSLIANGIIAGVGAVLIFLPQILILFFFIAILEDCGYMARAALLLDRWMGLIGLNGKSLIPLLSSFACAVPGIMATRTIGNRRDRFVTILIAPLMSCSARLPIYALMIGAFVPATPLLGRWIGLQGVTLLAMYFVGIVVAVVVALTVRRTILRGETQSFLMELPTYKWPSPRTVLYRVYGQGKAFCMSAGTIIVAMTIVVWALGYYPHPASVAADHDMQRAAARQAHAERLAGLTTDGGSASAVGEETLQANQLLEHSLSRIDRNESGTYLRQSVLGRMGQWIEPIVEPLGWDWRIGTAVVASFPAREIVVATMGTIYNLGDEHDETSAGLREKLRAATWPDGRPVFNIAVALSIMVFFALCCQCGGTLVMIRRETQSWRWPLLTFSYMTALAYLGALITYQVGSRFL